MESEKKFDSKIIIICLLFVVIAGLGGFFVGKKNGETVEKKEVSANQPALEGTNTAGFEDVEKLEEMINDLEYLENYVEEISEDKPLTDEMILNFAFRIAMQETDSLTITINDVNKVSNRYFGVDVKPADIPCPVAGPVHGSDGVVEHNEPWYKFDESTKAWAYVDAHPHGGGGHSDVFNKVVNALYRDGVYKIGVVKAFGEYTDFVGVKLYATLDDAKSKKNAVIDGSDGLGNVDSISAYMRGLFEEYDGDGFHTFEYTFEKTDTGFVLKSLKMVK